MLPEELADLYLSSRLCTNHLGTVRLEDRLLQGLEIVQNVHRNRFGATIWLYDVVGPIHFLVFWYQDVAVAWEWTRKCRTINPALWGEVLRNRSEPIRIEESRCAKDLPFFLADASPLSSAA